jgi:predicted nucleotidyltransferase
MTKQYIDECVAQVVDQVVELVQPHRIILFGSAVTGLLSDDSDLDFLVVIPEALSIRESVDVLNTRVRNKPLPCDFIVATQSMLDKHRQTHGLIYEVIVNQGMEVYAA